LYLGNSLHIMSGKSLALDRKECQATLERNLRHILPELEKRSVIGLVSICMCLLIFRTIKEKDIKSSFPELC